MTQAFLTSGQAAAQIGVTIPGLRRLIERGALSPLAVTGTGKRLFSREDVARVAEARRTLRLADRRRQAAAADTS